MIEKSMKNIRQEFKKNGIYYTPPELAEKLYSYVDVEVNSVYDPTCGVGNLLRVFPSHVMKYGQELDAEQLDLVDIPNFIGFAGDTLKTDGFMGMKFDCIVANPPFSVKWTPEKLKEDVRFKGLPLPPPSKADWAFILHILHHLSDEGVAVILEFPGILYRGQKEYQVRKWFVENNYIDRVVHVPGDVFEDTKICTCILVLRKNKKTTDITFENEKHTITVPLQEVVDNDYTLSVNTYIQEERQVEEINIDDINRQVVVQLLRKVDSTIKNLTELRKTFPNDNFYLMELLEGLKEIILISEVADSETN